MLDTAKIGRNGTLVIPAKMRRRLGLADGELVLIEETGDGLTIRPAVATPMEAYTPQRKAAFLLNNAVNAKDYAGARKAVIKMGLDPDAVPRQPPGR